MEDLRASLTQFYEFLKSYDYIEATTRISSNLYDQACGIIKRDNEASASASEQAAMADAQPENSADDRRRNVNANEASGAANNNDDNQQE